MSIQKELHKLLNAGVIDEPTANRIRNFYQQETPASSNRLFLVFGILGALLVGLGVILILAHNWDDLSRFFKTIIAFVPLLISQALCAYALFKKPDSVVWRESTSTLLVFAVGASIALISQIYHIPGKLESFLLVWSVLVLPIVYLMRSYIASLLYLAGITWYGTFAGYSWRPEGINWYWVLLLAMVPFYVLMYLRRPNSNAATFHNWVIPISLTIMLGSLSIDNDELMILAYMNLMGVFYLIGYFGIFKNQSLFRNGYRIFGALGSIGILLSGSFGWFWEEVSSGNKQWFGQELIVSIGIAVVALCLLGFHFRKTKWKELPPMALVFLVFMLIFTLNAQPTIIPVVLVNILVFAVGLLTLRKGGQENHLGILNYGLLIITALIICRFFDVDVPFVWRGLLFVLVGVGFFMANYWMLQKRKNNEV